MIVCNTSPIYYLHKIGRLHVLGDLFTEISIPTAVVQELDEGKRLGYNAPDVRDFQWIKQHSVIVPAALGALGIGSGETEAITLALNNTVKLILLDDGEARRAALERKLPVMGTIGVLVTSVRKGILPQLADSLDQLASEGFRVSDTIREWALKSVGEGI